MHRANVERSSRCSFLSILVEFNHDLDCCALGPSERSSGSHASRLGNSWGHARVTGGAVRPLVLDEPQALLPPRTPRLPTGVPTGVDAVVRSLRSRRPTGQGPQRRGHDDQTPGVPTGCGTAPPIRVEPEGPLTVLITRVRRPALAIQADDLGGAPGHQVRDQHDRAARPRPRAHNGPRGAPGPGWGDGPPA